MDEQSMRSKRVKKRRKPRTPGSRCVRGQRPAPVHARPASSQYTAPVPAKAPAPADILGSLRRGGPTEAACGAAHRWPRSRSSHRGCRRGGSALLRQIPPRMQPPQTRTAARKSAMPTAGSLRRSWESTLYFLVVAVVVGGWGFGIGSSGLAGGRFENKGNRGKGRTRDKSVSGGRQAAFRRQRWRRLLGRLRRRCGGRLET
ncbi:hypothetical protein DFJ73DRAFT_763032 [Zopfochytrium polystomum]|nr:hypothetical protein DFJ73DRAFT_763032 [Zopfochytrium polystomum]